VRRVERDLEKRVCDKTRKAERGHRLFLAYRQMASDGVMARSRLCTFHTRPVILFFSKTIRDTRWGGEKRCMRDGVLDLYWTCSVHMHLVTYTATTTHLLIITRSVLKPSTPSPHPHPP
jgi:hypothetical protein